ncbi:hypothetical protein AX14_006327 [Amanita brunnescens Koide BX004]|nr:hypothetical protein AX14_006327 [Amanita brunnescens Koide BX004]
MVTPFPQADHFSQTPSLLASIFLPIPFSIQRRCPITPPCTSSSTALASNWLKRQTCPRASDHSPRIMSSASLSLGNTLGAAFIGVVVASALLGVSGIQTWYYFTHHNDAWPIRALVSAVMVFDTLHQILITHSVYTYVIIYFGDYAQLNSLVWSLIIEVLFNGLVGLLVQSFLTMRLWRLSNRNIWLTLIVASLVAAEFVCIVVYTSMAISLKTFTQLAGLKRLSITINALAAASDVMIAAILCTLLHKSRTGFQRSDTMINKLILFAVNTGLLTSLCAIASLISIVVSGETFIYIAFFFCMGRLYSNSLLATLNARRMIRGADGFQSTDDNFSVSLRDVSKTAGIGSRRPGNISIKIDTAKATDRDSEKDQTGGTVRQSSIELTMMKDKEGSAIVNGSDYA